MPNALKLAASAKRKEREGSALSTSSQGESRKRKRSALEEIKMVNTYKQCTVYMYACIYTINNVQVYMYPVQLPVDVLNACSD